MLYPAELRAQTISVKQFIEYNWLTFFCKYNLDYNQVLI